MRPLSTKRVGPEKLRQLLPQLDSHEFSPDVFEKTGIFIIRGAIPLETLSLWQTAWQEFYDSGLTSDRPINKYNPVAVDQEPPPVLAKMHEHPGLLDIVEKALGPDIALYNQRFVIKDHQSRGPVFAHQDFPYHLGWPTKASAFVALGPVTPENGGLFFYPGSHQYGYFGDAGEVNTEILGPDWPKICPSLEPGDVALMNSSTWHGSGPHVSGPDRIVADIIYQPADDPSGIALLRGHWQTEIFLDRKQRDRLFIRSRASRLKELQSRVDELEGKFGSSAVEPAIRQ